MNLNKALLPILILLILAGCSIPVDVPPTLTALPPVAPQPTLTVAVGFTPVPLLTQAATSLPTSAPVIPASFCDDPRAHKLIASLGKAVSSNDGELLASLVSPVKGMDVRFYRSGNVINYDVEHAKFVFDSAFQADWGVSFGSGLPILGAFHDIVVPSLQQVFTPTALLVCNQLKVGSATYEPLWPYPKMDFYSVHLPGTDAYGGMDWQTWAVGMDTKSGKPMLAALMHFVWEP